MVIRYEKVEYGYRDNVLVDVYFSPVTVVVLVPVGAILVVGVCGIGLPEGMPQENFGEPLI